MNRRLILGLLLTLVLVACGGDTYKGNAQITGHEYDDADDEWVPGYSMPGSCSGGFNGQPRYCSPSIYVPPHMNHRPERFLLHVKWTDDKGKPKTDVRETSKGTYDECPDGRTINLESMKCPRR